MVATAILVGVCLIVGCIYAVFDNFGKGKSENTVFTPDGAPALSMAKLFAEDTANDRVAYTVVSATGIEARVLYSDMKKNMYGKRYELHGRLFWNPFLWHLLR